jgi:hypothetical protein
MQQFIVDNAQIILPIVSIWSLAWKGYALWVAARKESKIWFVVILVLNTIGLLEILYIFVLSKVDYAKLGAKLNFGKLTSKIKGGFKKK